MGQPAGLTKAKLKLQDAGVGCKCTEITCKFNPTDYKVATSAEWKTQPTQGAKKAPEAQFIGTKPRTMTLKLFFDVTDGAGDIQKDVDGLFEWTCPTPKSHKTKTPHPPVVLFQWGKDVFPPSYIKSAGVNYTLFKPDGTPLRATADVSLEEVPDDSKAKPQNPTSGGPHHGQRSVVVAAGDSLHSIAYDEYGHPRFWRSLAATNGIDDPLRVRPGATLVLPPLADVAELA